MRKDLSMVITHLQGLVGLVFVGAGFYLRDQWFFALGAVLYLGSEIGLLKK